MSKRKPPPLDSPDWRPLDDAYCIVCAKTGSPKFAMADLEQTFIDGDVHVKVRDHKGQRLLDWRKYKLGRRKDRLVVPRRADNIFDEDAAYYVWKPEFEKLWPTATPTTPSAPPAGSAGAWIDSLFRDGEWRLMTAKDIHGKIVLEAKKLGVKAPSYSAVAAELKDRLT
jgi:hypothetical protein